MLKYVCHFHHHPALVWHFLKFDHYRDTRAAILDPCIQGIFWLSNWYHRWRRLTMVKTRNKTCVSYYGEDTKVRNYVHISAFLNTTGLHNVVLVGYLGSKDKLINGFDQRSCREASRFQFFFWRSSNAVHFEMSLTFGKIFVFFISPLINHVNLAFEMIFHWKRRTRSDATNHPAVESFVEN